MVLVIDLALLGIGLLLGWLLDKVVDSAPLLELFGLVVAFIIAMAFTWSRLRGPTGAS
jgi:F0F1-type ATP synthase assembly protein I